MPGADFALVRIFFCGAAFVAARFTGKDLEEDLEEREAVFDLMAIKIQMLDARRRLERAINPTLKKRGGSFGTICPVGKEEFRQPRGAAAGYRSHSRLPILDSLRTSSDSTLCALANDAEADIV